MYSHRYIRENFSFLKDKLTLRGVSEETLIEIKLSCDELQNLLKQKIQLETERNNFIKKGALENKDQIKEIKEKISVLLSKEKNLTEELNEKIYLLPNLPDDSLSQEIIAIKEWGTKKQYPYSLISHQELAKQHNLFSLAQGALISGEGYVVYSGIGAQVYRALIQFTLDFNKSRGYIEKYLPVVVSPSSLLGTSQLPKFKNDLFWVSDDKYLSPTSETQLVNLYRDQIISSSQLPIKLTANTNCFRREAGGSGTETAGIIRLHQFNKTEIVTICKESESFNYLEDMVNHACQILENLNLPYRVILLPYNDMSFSSAKTYDIEVWFPSENRYREISSVSNTLDFQSKRIMLRYKDSLLSKEEKTKYPHILNGSSLAIDRLFAAILDNYQNEDKSISIPEKLISILGFSKIS